MSARTAGTTRAAGATGASRTTRAMCTLWPVLRLTGSGKDAWQNLNETRSLLWVAERQDLLEMLETIHFCLRLDLADPQECRPRNRCVLPRLPEILECLKPGSHHLVPIAIHPLEMRILQGHEFVHLILIQADFPSQSMRATMRRVRRRAKVWRILRRPEPDKSEHHQVQCNEQRDKNPRQSLISRCLHGSVEVVVEGVFRADVFNGVATLVKIPLGL